MAYNPFNLNPKSDDFRNKNFSGKWQKKYIDEFIKSTCEKGNEETLKIFSDYNLQHLPSSLYKFYSGSSNSLNSLLNNKIHLSDPRSFNDPFDSFICVEKNPYFKDSVLKKLKTLELVKKTNSNDYLNNEEYSILENTSIKGNYQLSLDKSNSFFSKLDFFKFSKSENFRLKLNSIQAEVYYQILDNVKAARNTGFRISCFSNFRNELELGKNTTMWSHYADNHKGFCVKYSTYFENDIYKDLIKCSLFPVIYTSRVPKLTKHDFLAINKNGNIGINYPNTLRKVYKSVLTKSKFWSYENEWRLIVGHENRAYLTNDSMPFSKIDEIFIGCRASENLTLMLVNFAESNGIRICKSVQSDEKFELDFFETSSEKLKNDYYYKELYRINRLTDAQERKHSHSILDKIFPSLK